MVTTLTSIATLIVALQNVPDDSAKKSAQELARKCAEATVKNDIGTVIDLTHPMAVSAMGGREKAIKLAREAMKKSEQDGVKIVSVERVLPPEKIHASKRAYYCVVPVSFQITIDDSKFLLRSALIGISIDSGKKWKFVDISLGEKTVRKFLPDMPGELKFPAKPEVIPEKQGGD